MIDDVLLMGPGPSNAYPEVLTAMSQPLLGHLDHQFLELLDETNSRMRTLFGTSNQLTFPVSGTGSAGMEIGFVNLVKPGDVVVVGVNGVFGTRMVEVAARKGAEVISVEYDWGTPVTADRLLSAHPNPSMIAMVHAETSTGVRSDVAEVGAGKGDALLFLDCVTSLGGIPVNLDEWGVDMAYAGTQKCLGVPPGLAPFSINERAIERVVARPTSWYLDLNLIGGYVGPGARQYHHTAPISMIYGLHAGLGVVLDEGIEACHVRHAAVGAELQRRMPEMGFDLFAQDGHRLPELTTVVVPEHLQDREAAIRKSLRMDYNIEIGGGLGPVAGKVWRIGLMGGSARMENVERFVGALKQIIG